ncbi:ATP-binding protein [Aeoliella mucimassa]|uniref:histidine kinase n=1 Tax=Aeoliella mucimassa TaxID=2527972 RepID=A0A518ARB8_9BACT|nr:ATP-binding protein [Aeoliella mucimassa]QDU57269.1 Sensor protein ZraS [Aeoliella mucimassa]
MPNFFVIQGRDQGSRYDLDGPVVTLGRVASNSIQLHDTEVSREHAILEREGDTYRFRDLGSSNGSFINRRAVNEHLLTSGDQIQLGRTLLLYTGTPLERPDLSEQINIVAADHKDDESRILHAVSQSDSSDLLSAPSDDQASPWLARARSNLQIMYRTALAVSHTLDIDQLLARIMEMIFEWVDADRGCIMLKDELNGSLSPRVRRHRRGVQTEDKITISQTILDYVVERNEGVLTSNARDDQRWDPAQSIVKLGVREAICVPMQGRYDVVGVIYIDTSLSPQRMLQERTTTKFTQEHLKLMVAIAHQAALAVEDTSYYKAMVQAERLAAVGQTIASLSHHIKNILQGVRGGSYLIELAMQDHAKAVEAGEMDPDDMARMMDTLQKGWKIVERNQQRISGLVMDMLTYSKEREPEPVAAELNDVVADVVELMQVRATELSTALIFRPDNNIPTSMFDPEAIHRAVLNIVTNAVDACDDCDRREVTVTTKWHDKQKQAFIEVTDSGIGIAPDDIENIFTVFVSGKGGRGTGLGLPVSQKIMQEHGGTIRVESEPGSGSKFTMELPMQKATPPKQPILTDDDSSGSNIQSQTFAPGT